MKAIFLLAGFCTFLFFNQIIDFVYKARHPGLINFDYGILSREDLDKSDQGSLPVMPFSGENLGYPYWQCFNKNFLKMNCNYVEPLDQQGSSLALSIETKSEIHFYSLNHAVSGEVCDSLKKEIDTVIKGQNYFCINGTPGGVSTNGKPEYTWSFYGVKTKDGYARYLLTSE